MVQSSSKIVFSEYIFQQKAGLYNLIVRQHINVDILVKNAGLNAENRRQYTKKYLE